MTEAHYLLAAGTEREAVRFENATLTADKATLPRCAQDVLDGRGASSEYWAWLTVRWFAAAIAGAVELHECSGANPYEAR